MFVSNQNNASQDSGTSVICNPLEVEGGRSPKKGGRDQWKCVEIAKKGRDIDSDDLATVHGNCQVASNVKVDHSMDDLQGGLTVGDMSFFIVNVLHAFVSAQFGARKIGKQFSANCCKGHIVLSFNLQSFMTLLSVSAWAEDTYIGSTLRSPSVSSTPSSLISPSDENIQLETLGEEFGLAGSIWWGEHIRLWVLVSRMHWYCEDSGHFGASYLSENFVWWDASVLWGQYLHHRHHDIQIIHLILGYAFYRLLKRLRLHCGLAITVVERLQRYNCIWLTYIVNVEQNILFYIEVWSCEMLSLCGELIWRWNFVFRLCFVFRRTLYRRLCMNHFVLEELRDLFRCLVEPNSVRLVLASWLFTFGWEPVCFENF